MKDVLIVGSGAGGVNATWPLVERGLSVQLLDYGNLDAHYEPLIDPRPWSELRREDSEQHRYFLGDRFEGLPMGPVRVGAQLTPPRAFITADTEREVPIDSSTFSVTESLARGGLASGWGAGVFPFDDQDLEGSGVTRAMLEPHYEAVADRIGVSGERDDLSPFLGECAALLPALELDSGGEAVLARYTDKRERLKAEGFRLGRTWLAACSREHRGRGPHPHLDMDFWSDAARAVYRPRWTLEELQEKGGFQYTPRQRVETFHERPDGVTVRTRDTATGEPREFAARALVLAAGTLGTARIVLRSLDLFGKRLPVLCNPYTYAPVLNLGMIGTEARDRRHSLAQLTGIYQPPGSRRVAQAQYYSYRSLLLFKLIKESPLGHLDSRRLFRLLQPVLGILGIHHEDRPTSGKSLSLERSSEDAPDKLRIDYAQTAPERERQLADEKHLLRAFRRLGCVALKRIEPGHGSAVHYAGTLPMSTEDKELTCDFEGRLRGTRSVFVADGSIFPILPAKGLTFTIMACADRVGSRLAERLA